MQRAPEPLDHLTGLVAAKTNPSTVRSLDFFRTVDHSEFLGFLHLLAILIAILQLLHVVLLNIVSVVSQVVLLVLIGNGHDRPLFQAINIICPKLAGLGTSK